MEGCLDDNEASEFASGSLDPPQTVRIEMHLATCRDCRSLVAALAPSLDDADADSDVVTSPRKVARGKRGKRTDIAIAPTERPRGPSTPPERPMTSPARRRDPVVAAGDTIGRYIILARLGAGGMGVVYTAYDPQLDRKVALKLLRAGGAIADDEARSRLVREAQAIAQLSHPNVVAVYDVGTADTGEVYIAMELVEGETMTSWLGHWDRSWREILDLFFQAGRGLSAAHARGLVHRDFKPDNVLVGTDGRVRVTDFGLARSLIDQVEEELRDRPRPDLAALRVTLTATGTVLGTPRYMAPEQLRGADADARSDQFSFCVALFEALYGLHPLPGDSVIEMVQHAAEPQPPPADTKVPPQIGRAIMRGLSSEPNKRFPTLAALLLEATPPPLHTGRRGWLMLVGALALVIGGAAAAMVAMDMANTRKEGELYAQLLAEQKTVDDLMHRIEILESGDGGITDKTEQIRILEARLIAARAKVTVLERQLGVAADALMLAGTQPHVVRPPPSSRADAGLPPAHGVSQSDFLAGVATEEGRVRQCMAEYVIRAEGKGAAFQVDLEINPDGTVRKTQTQGGDDVVSTDCAVAAIGDARFPPATGVTHGRVTVNVENEQVSVSSKVLGASQPGETMDLNP
jgi:tRNA A-37 threonylcarbamoyl transferase component Bud32